MLKVDFNIRIVVYVIFIYRNGINEWYVDGVSARSRGSSAPARAIPASESRSYPAANGRDELL